MKNMMKILLICVLCAVAMGHSVAGAAWKPRSIYQIVTDRFNIYPTPTGGLPTCDVKAETYCGGNFAGII